ncbi:MAG TPA: hypothetical protein VG935_02605, partial [Patescibacteria group bacterium]|nr:hypothetical protein [Patescibacteria group bacterium]
DPSTFIQSFHPADQKPLDYHCEGIEGCVLYSPLYPHQKLEVTTLTSTTITFSQQGIYGTQSLVMYDPFWKVFLLMPSEKISYYGPYRFILK